MLNRHQDPISELVGTLALAILSTLFLNYMYGVALRGLIKLVLLVGGCIHG